MSDILNFTWEADIPSAEAVRSCKGGNEGANWGQRYNNAHILNLLI